MTNKKIGFVCGVSQSHRMMYALSVEMQKKYGILVSYICFQNDVVDYLRSKGVSPEVIVNLHEGFVYRQWGNEDVDMEYLVEMEKRHGIPNLWLMWETIRTHHRNHKLHDALKIYEKTYRIYEKFADECDLDAVLTHVYPGTIPSFVMSQVFGSKEIPVYTIFPHRMAGRFVIYTGVKDEYARIDRIFDSLKKRPMTTSEKDKAEAFLNRFKEKKYFSSQEKLLISKKEISFSKIHKAVNGVVHAYRYKTYRTFRHTHPLGPLIYLKNRSYSLINRRILERTNLFEKPDWKEKYVLFFLHKQPETSTLAKAPFYLDQVSLILNISKSLPIDFRLYVKPHHNDFGNLSRSYYQELSARPNIRLLSVHTNGHELIRNARLVITITGSVGWEGLLFEKPVFTFGNVFYNSFPLIKKVNDVSSLPYLICDAIENHQPDRELLLKYIAAHQMGSYEGTPIAPVLDETTSLNEENLMKVARGIGSELGLKITGK